MFSYKTLVQSSMRKFNFAVTRCSVVSMACSTPALLVLHYLLEFASAHVHWVIQPSIDAIPSSHPVSPFSCLPSFPALESLPVSWLFTSGDLNIVTSASVLPMNIQVFPLGLTGLISLLSKGLSRVFSNTTVQRHQFFSIQPSLWSNSYIHTWLLEKP